MLHAFMGSILWNTFSSTPNSSGLHNFRTHGTCSILGAINSTAHTANARSSSPFRTAR